MKNTMCYLKSSEECLPPFTLLLLRSIPMKESMYSFLFSDCRIILLVTVLTFLCVSSLLWHLDCFHKGFLSILESSVVIILYQSLIWLSLKGTPTQRGFPSRPQIRHKPHPNTCFHRDPLFSRKEKFK